MSRSLWLEPGGGGICSICVLSMPLGRKYISEEHEFRPLVRFAEVHGIDDLDQLVARFTSCASVECPDVTQRIRAMAAVGQPTASLL